MGAERETQRKGDAYTPTERQSQVECLLLNVLLIEDEVDIAHSIRKGLSLVGFVVEHARDIRSASSKLSQKTFDAVIHNITLPDGDGLTLASRIRTAGCETPLLMLTARGSVTDRLAGFEHGTDDYLGKPFDVNELAAWLRAMIRRATKGERHILRYADLVLEYTTKWGGAAMERFNRIGVFLNQEPGDREAISFADMIARASHASVLNFIVVRGLEDPPTGPDPNVSNIRDQIAGTLQCANEPHIQVSRATGMYEIQRFARNLALDLIYRRSMVADRTACLRGGLLSLVAQGAVQYSGGARTCPFAHGPPAGVGRRIPVLHGGLGDRRGPRPGLRRAESSARRPIRVLYRIPLSLCILA